MNALIFTDTDARILIAAQSGQHRLSPIQLTDGSWFLMEDVLTEIPGIYDRKLIVPYTVIPFEDIVALIPQPTEEL
jgi:NADH pyrophosphatase NudC (nudix superfamily)